MLNVLHHGVRGQIAEIRLARPPVNALNPPLIAALRAALGDVAQNGAEAVILSGAEGCFSAGLDVPALLKLDRIGMRALWEDFFTLLRAIASFERPVVAAMTGHSPAGGTVLALFADQRIMADGPFLVGLNEVQVGLSVPTVLLRALTYVVGARHAERLAVGGLLIGPAEALRVGLIDEVVPPQQVIARSVSLVTELLARPQRALLETRARARQPLRDSFADLDSVALDATTEQWFSDETQSTLRALATRLGKPARVP